MLKVYTGKPITYLNLPLILDYAKNPVAEIVTEPHLADYFLIPYNFTHVQYEDDYLDYFLNLARRADKKIIVFWFGDSSGRIYWPDAIVFRTSQYKSVLRPNEIIMPTVVDDLGTRYGFETRLKAA